MSEPQFLFFCESESASFVRVNSPSGKRRFFLGDRYQKNVLLLYYLQRDCGLTLDDASLAVTWTDGACVGDTVSFDDVTLTGESYDDVTLTDLK